MYVKMLTLLAVHAHPDDETITMGGTLARSAAEGVRTVVVTCTLGDLGEVRDPTLSHAHDVAALRTRELQAAVRTLGVARLVQLGYGDSGMAGDDAANQRPQAFINANLHAAAQQIVDVLEEERPEVMVAYDETGGYGHPDHVRAHEVAVAAYRAAPPASRPARLYFVRFPLTWSREFVRALRAAGIDAPGSAPAGADAGPDVPEIGVPDHLITTRIDVGAYVPNKLAALRCHASQMSDHFLTRVPPRLAERLWAYEFYSLEDDRCIRARRPPEGAAGDLFAGLDA